MRVFENRVLRRIFGLRKNEVTGDGMCGHMFPIDHQQR
jgi:hypothetical protein